MEATLKADLKLAAEDRAAMRAEREKFHGQAWTMNVFANMLSAANYVTYCDTCTYIYILLL